MRLTFNTNKMFFYKLIGIEESLFLNVPFNFLNTFRNKY
ncbi:Hypothetical protein FP1555 [Flavobacterium psychrophilum JIP02/86]|uniref:Uncharacterized protein n=1 Tax=Flavobacterium psychrophilum (strain ATCC 49511 / DSM 21280 / CIP 103535 / JIP02/86) TaxID=402612 RepID=A6GZV0_FLAPJ|nr:hypothetical protein [Flavobacterium psychrophilum]CAL43623.1 Hypothetical protein FP1555 [Flavobacterium psychrophilum JIP02/86]QGS63999.1 hypothetical protein GMY06_09290 [Flavobacterium psychrophilum]SNA31634.1 conserved hypothetical protein [Flavobacterium psychrophilum]SNA64811.1 conserved hypothetical protein [Flavobacterium psychrophilum]